MSLTSDLCNENLLGEMTAEANQVNNPVEPFPAFFGAANCLSEGGAFPNNNVISDCSSTGLPTASSNCLRIISDLDNSFDPFNPNTGLEKSQVNVLPNPPTNSNVFSNDSTVLRSLYCPPQYVIVFYTSDPSQSTLAQAASNGYLMVTPNTVLPDMCLAYTTLNNGTPFLKYLTTGNYNGTGPPPCLLAWCNACANLAGGSVAQGDFCATSQDYIACGSNGNSPAISHNAPYFIVIKKMDFGQMLFNMCVNNTQYSLGPLLANNSLNRIWKAQTTGCDGFVTNLCHYSDLQDSDYAEVCACFTQQQALDNIYGASLGVGVCCFGTDPSGQITKSCAFDPVAYKTSSMSKSCCTFAQCQKVVLNSSQMQTQTPTPGQISCAGNFVVFPTPIADEVVATPSLSVLSVTTSSIPSYTWIFLVTAVILLLLFIFSLAFV